MVNFILFFALHADCKECQSAAKVRAVVTVETEASLKRRGVRTVSGSGITPPVKVTVGNRSHHLFGHRSRGSSASCSGGSCR